MVEYKISLHRFLAEKGEFSYEMIPMDLVEHINYDVPKEVSVNFYFGNLVTVDYKIRVFDKRTSFSSSSETVISDDAFLFKKSAFGGDGVFLFQFYFEKKQEAIALERYTKFYENHIKVKKLLPVGVYKKSKTKFTIANWFVYVYLLMMVILAIKRCGS